MADDAEARHDDDVDFRVSEEPQDMLVEHRIAAAGGIEKRGAEVAVGQKHGDRAGEHRQAEQDEPGGDEDRPAEQRHFEQRHARCAHVQEGGDHVDRAKDREAPETWTAKIARSIDMPASFTDSGG